MIGHKLIITNENLGPKEDRCGTLNDSGRIKHSKIEGIIIRMCMYNWYVVDRPYAYVRSV